jgi:hypothetical protein
MTSVVIDGETLFFDELDANNDNEGQGFRLPILYLRFLHSLGTRYAIDSNKRVWIEIVEENYFESPCLSCCLDIIKSDPQEYEKVNNFLFENEPIANWE